VTAEIGQFGATAQIQDTAVMVAVVCAIRHHLHRALAPGKAVA
jgi:hypothetical protein